MASEGVVFVVVVIVAGVVILMGVVLIVVVEVVAIAEDFLRRFFSIPRGRKRLAVLATGFR